MCIDINITTTEAIDMPDNKNVTHSTAAKNYLNINDSKQVGHDLLSRISNHLDRSDLSQAEPTAKKMRVSLSSMHLFSVSSSAYCSPARASNWCSSQQTYGESAKKLVIDAVKQWRHSKTAASTVEFIEARRRTIAVEAVKASSISSDYTEYDFGKLREKPLISPLSLCEPLLKRGNGLFSQSKNHPGETYINYQYAMSLYSEMAFVETSSKQGGKLDDFKQLRSYRSEQQPILIGEVAVSFAEIVFPPDGDASNPIWRKYFPCQKSGVIVHPSPADAQLMRDHAITLFQSVMNATYPNSDTGLQAALNSIAEIHWWLAQATPYQRGSASIAEFVAKVAMVHHNIDFSGWQSDVLADVEAMIASKEHYQSHYSELFIHPPRFMNSQVL